MKTWVLTWFLVFPPVSVNKDITWEAFQQGGLTMQECFDIMVEKDVEFKQLKDDGKVIGIKLSCKEDKSGLKDYFIEEVE